MLLIAETTRVLKANSVTKVGRDHSYKSDPSSVHISDLKVPKKYAAITVGSRESNDNSPSPLSIRFESICTTDANGKIFKLPSRDSDPIEQEFSDKEILLKINANKSDRIRLRLKWEEVTIMPFAKKILFGGDVQQSPFPEDLEALRQQEIDIRITADPFIATHYAAPTEHVDYNLQIAVLRGIPIVTAAWLEYLAKYPDNVDHWLHSIDSGLILRSSYTLPDSRRMTFMANACVVLCTDNINLKASSRLQKWLSLLGVELLILESSTTSSTVSLVKEIEQRFGSEQKIIPFNACSGDLRCRELFGLKFNNLDDLWRAVESADEQKLKFMSVEDLPHDELLIKEEPESLRPTQRRKRRKVTKVSDTDFFLFTPNTSSPAERANELRMDFQEDLQPQQQIEQESSITGSFSIRARSPVDQQSYRAQESSNQTESNNENEAHGNEIDDNIEERKEEVEKDTRTEEPPQKKPKLAKIIPQVSLVDAIISTKQEAVRNAKQEVTDDLDGKLSDLVIVEEVNLLVRREVTSAAVELVPAYRGRKNFKLFRKAGPKPNNFTRSFIELQDDTNEVLFADLQTTLPLENAGRIKKDFEKEMDSVRGYQPELSQLFVPEDEDAFSGDDDNSFKFLEPQPANNSWAEHTHDADDDDNFTFAFSRR